MWIFGIFLYILCHYVFFLSALSCPFSFHTPKHEVVMNRDFFSWQESMTLPYKRLKTIFSTYYPLYAGIGFGPLWSLKGKGKIDKSHFIKNTLLQSACVPIHLISTRIICLVVFVSDSRLARVQEIIFFFWDVMDEWKHGNEKHLYSSIMYFAEHTGEQYRLREEERFLRTDMDPCWSYSVLTQYEPRQS